MKQKYKGHKIGESLVINVPERGKTCPILITFSGTPEKGYYLFTSVYANPVQYIALNKNGKWGRWTCTPEQAMSYVPEYVNKRTQIGRQIKSLWRSVVRA